MKIINIKWDTDRDLPKEVEVDKKFKDIEEISDYLTDTFGFCNKGFELEGYIKFEFVD